MATTQGVETRPTAGLRGASWNPELLPAGMSTSVHAVATADGAQVTGYLHACGGERGVVVIMHPRELLATHYLVPSVLAAGHACWAQGTRTPGNDLRLEHEIALIDVAAGLVHLRRLGFERIVLLGNSGGAGLFAFYNQQALLAPAQRLARTPAGRPTKLGEVEMPRADGFVLIAPHPGQGRLLLNCIDPSIVDEKDPLSIDPALDPFSAANGFRAKPQSSSYAPEFVERYRRAQRARVERIDAFATAMIAERQAARARSKTAPEVRADAMRGALNEIFFVWRTDADLRCFDQTLDPSDRRWGTVWGADPIASNLGSVGFARVCTTESWLSTWSGLSSRASFELCGGSLEQPVLMLDYTGDSTVFPSDADALYATIASSSKRRQRVRGNHHGHALAAGEPSGQEIAGRLVTEWLRDTVRSSHG
jgi:hypothetical protein